MSIELTTHRAAGPADCLNASLRILAIDCGPSHHNSIRRWGEGIPRIYHLSGFETLGNRASRGGNVVELELLFQNGAPALHGVNGLSTEALLAVALDRIEWALKDDKASPWTRKARESLMKALYALAAVAGERASEISGANMNPTEGATI